MPGSTLVSATTKRPAGQGQTSWRQGVYHFVRAKPLGALGGILIVVMVVMALFASLLAPYDPYELHISQMFAPPGRTFSGATTEGGPTCLPNRLRSDREWITDPAFKPM